MIGKLRHFYLNKYLISNFSSNRYPISYSLNHKTLWFRTTKVASRTIDFHLKKDASRGEYIYSSPVGYEPSFYRNYFKFAFVRNPIDRFVSAFRDKVLHLNYFEFGEEQYQKMKDISSFIDWVISQEHSQLDEHLQEQSSMIDLRNINFIGRFERFADDFKFVSRRIGLDFDPFLKLNKSPRRIDVKLSEIDRQKIATLYRKDVRVFYPEEIHRINRSLLMRI